ncbi:hypothetical protein RHGRI_038678 [Rhododendron griersonianum]|uniref:PB1 domain-containing protein n=1 Tax=Rhododendron griersonianum TaxID=479676 RepID=A0AAV6HLB3_9ERIC|nr:hypothetical protein RHGRI_038678 [Rhododendron griersonianum]
MELEQRTTLEELGMDPENEGIISDLLRFVRDKEEFFKKAGKDWKRGYLFCDSPGTDRSSLIAAMANFLEFDIYHLDLTGLTSISELTNVLVSIRNRSLIAIQDFDQWAGKLPDFKTELTLSVGRPPDQHGEGNTSAVNLENGLIIGSSTEWTSQVEAFLMGHVSESSNLAFPAYSDAAAPSQPVATILQTMPMTTHMIPQTGGFSGIFQLEGQLTQSTSHPNPNVVPPEPQIASTQMLSENMGSLENWEEFLSLEEETSLGGHVFGSVNLTVTTCCDPSLRQQPVPTNRDMMPTTHMMSHLVAREDIRSVTVKVSYGDRTIKFQVPLMSRIIEVKEEVKKRLKLEPSNFDFEYKDEDDGDWIFLGCDEDLTNHLQLFSNRVIRLLVVDSDASTKNICESCGSLKRKRQ